jgi:hypothetical protein
MQLARLVAVVFVLSVGWMAQAQDTMQASPPAIEVMVLGVYHMSNPDHDLHDAKSDDVLSPERQQQIEALTNELARFKPTKVAVEWDAATVAERYPKFLSGALPPSHNEVVQLGFRLAKSAHAVGVYGIDADGDFPWERVKDYADAYGFKQLLKDAQSAENTTRLQSLIDEKGISAALRFLNSPEQIRQDNGFYRTLLRIGSGTDQPGADLVADWQHRNLLICANLLQLSKPGDRVVVIFGAGHGLLLRQCVEETPGFKLVDVNGYIPN